MKTKSIENHKNPKISLNSNKILKTKTNLKTIVNYH
jgi:hypothetical protein